MVRGRIVGAAGLVLVGLWGVATDFHAAGQSILIETTPPVECVRLISGATSRYRHLAVAELLKAGFTNISVQIERLDEASHKRGCYNGHMRAHQWGVERGCRTLLVAEDDVVFAHDLRHAWDVLGTFTETASTWDAVFLGYTAVRVDPTEYPGVVRLQKPMLAHAIVFPLATSRRIAAMPPWQPTQVNLTITEAYDVRLWYTGVVTEAFGLYPVVASQRTSQSTSFSRDKNIFINWAKSTSGLNWLAWLAYEQCAFYFRHADTAATWLGGIIDGRDDWASTARVFTCPDTETALPSA